MATAGCSQIVSINQPAESLIVEEGNFSCLRIIPRMWGVPYPKPPPIVGNRVVTSNDDWRQLWNYLRYDVSDSDPPQSLPNGDVAISISIMGSSQRHVHIRKIGYAENKIIIEYQTETRHFPLTTDGSSRSISDDESLESLVVFLPWNKDKQVIFKSLSSLDWTPERDTDVVSHVPCSYVR
jgi:hypothetical protein